MLPSSQGGGDPQNVSLAEYGQPLSPNVVALRVNMLGPDPSVPFPSFAELQKGLGQASPYFCLWVMALFQAVKVILANLLCCKHFSERFLKECSLFDPKKEEETIPAASVQV